ncbi:MAG: type II secretion system protein GspM [Deltaproteobacteria bacterium]|nr:type II secretion system protein GspM [Deltaproteobacteria bacterium]
MKVFWDRLSKRQQLTVAGGAGLVLVMLLIQLLILPFVDAQKTLNQAIRNNEKMLREMMLLARDYQVLKRQAGRIPQALARRPQNFSLYSHLEKIAGDAGVKANIKSINAAKGAISGPYEELPADIRLEKITLKQITDFLYLLEAPQELIRVKKIALAKMPESPEYLSAQVQAVTFQLTKVAGQ